ncbi:2-octaprenyl-6-methoxyphenol hydroxylase [hydrothermal vent metagenome]|uniref:2-octaprenyl-6-methoxyphenol hydroxylase n=1 Tax=hydrothermal vent metagenome TaxID=652676 RepID=A0A3B0WE34_9ZZZZ
MPEESKILDTEVAIVGGGLVGMAMAISLAQRDIASVLLEAQSPTETDEEQFDDRTLVINPASQLFWQDLGLWSEIESHTTTIEHVHVSNQGKFGVVKFDKDELKVPQLGHVVAAKTLANTLLKAVKQQTLISYLQPAKLLEFEATESRVKLTVEFADSSRVIAAQLMVGADGVQSPIRTRLNLPTAVKSYQRSAIVCNVTTSQRHQHRAFERLTTDGPMALLPFGNGSGQNRFGFDRFGFVWSLPTAQAEQLLKVDEESFLQQAQQLFGYRAGEFQQLGRRSSYPIYQIKVPVQHAHRVVLMGNAAHAVSPVSAQGLNLAVRGIGRLSEQLHQAKVIGQNLGSDSVLKAYQLASDEDQQRTLNYTDDLMTWFKIDEPFINVMRSLGLVAINASLNLKKTLFNTAGGLR